MTQTLDFALRATSEKDFWDSWILAGICSAPNEFTREYPGIQMTDKTSQGWAPERTTGRMTVDDFGNKVEEKEPVPGWHCNVKVTGTLVKEFEYGLDKYNEDDTLKNIFDRTWAKEVFGLKWQDVDPMSGFPAGYKNAAGTVTYCDTQDIKTPTNTWA